MATRAAGLIASLPYQGSYTYVGQSPPPVLDPVTGEEITTDDWGTYTVSLATIQNRQVAHLQRFAAIAARLGDLAGKELAHESFTPDDEQFLEGLVVEFYPYDGCSHAPSTGWGYSGWYPKLFYRTIYWDETTFDITYGSGASDTIVADVHTDVPDTECNDPGSVLHEGIGLVNLLLIAVDNGVDRFICAGPVLSHYELEVIGAPRRLTDLEWSGILVGNFPSDVDPSQVEGLAPPIWTTGYLVP
jgi:hypothetical protein